MTRKRRALLAAGVVIVVAVAVGVWAALRGREAGRSFLTAAGTVEATDGQLGFEATGRVQEILVHEGSRVKRGQEIAYLDRTEMTARRGQAEAEVAAARARLDELQRGFRTEEVAQARAARDAAQQRLSDAERDLERTRTLFQGGAVSQEALDKSQLALDVARSGYRQAEQQLRLMQSGFRKEQVQAQKAQLAQAEAALRATDAALANMTIEAPFDGVVTVRNREPGEVVSMGSPVVTVMNPDDRWVRIYIREDRIAAVHLGQPATITSDTYPDKKYGGQVVFVASEAEFTPKSVQTQAERVKLVYAVKVQITDDPDYDLKPGMPADVRIELNGGSVAEASGPS